MEIQSRGMSWRCVGLLAALLAVLARPVHAGDAGRAPDRAATLEQDMTGPAVAWVGRVAEVLRDGEDTCFVLNPVAGRAGTPPAFMACAFGGYDAAAFGVGRRLEVQGRLGAALPRQVAGRVFAMHLVVSARLSPALEPPPYDWPYPYGFEFGIGFGRCDPFWHPWPHHPYCW